MPLLGHKQVQAGRGAKAVKQTLHGELHSFPNHLKAAREHILCVNVLGLTTHWVGIFAPVYSCASMHKGSLVVLLWMTCTSLSKVLPKSTGFSASAAPHQMFAHEQTLPPSHSNFFAALLRPQARSGGHALLTPNDIHLVKESLDTTETI